MSAIAAEGMGIAGEASALIAPDSRAFAETITRFYRDKTAWYKLSDACLELVKDQNSLTHGRRILATALTRLGLKIPTA